ncbi:MULTISPECIES: tetratricopeptide repeat protein [unclassified Mesorhizobium]|uniref:winged helix-turn-helix domain-containing tetratricopeptide repeat protein n=1 Tax=unclassified Mesorhizobium TaxID=325217 RepID=UPI000FCAF74F|nr:MULTISPECIES: tetratricopeptide repeat protein [unclassified Mesorhizobium]TGP20307.1 CadC-family transcriptional regulator [Mesorhizobium sp. M1D.F.Ca.ET.231.01.1.1]TGP27784.1 CadC-family transcriptional regulator [Mesorhizobium sp. M1D.F.Ca.ET.234.01.1.1]TGS42134.1 CadC-family transcriptional regulator [Mesorhizobium sp. M1D.F.Ca.ET.184.01.1.1]TGS59486.1 CadC-family transcriptional regulator [Mesorhizobium sp. M1D.F.Ca.ET.183.01.1.1]
MTTFEFSGHRLDLHKGRLQRGGLDVDLRAKSLSLLIYLLENAGRVIGKDELVNAVWPNIAVSDDSLTQCMKDIRKALGPEADGLIRTVLRRGYVIDEDRVRRIGDRGASAGGAGEGAGDAPSIAVLPFENLSGDPAQDYFADGMVDEIITALSRMRWLFIIARNSSFAYKGQADGVKRAGAELGVRYVLTGSVRKAGDHIRLTGQLIDQSSGKTIWANRYDGTLADVFDLQDRFAESVVGAIQPSILSAEIERSRRKRPESLAAYDYVLRAFPLTWSLDRAQNDEAGTLLERAIAIEPDYPLALSLLAWCHLQRVAYHWTEAPAASREEGLRLAQKGAALSGDDPMVLAVLGAAHSFARDYEVAEMHLARARALDPNSAWAWLRSAWLDVYRERPEAAIEKFEHFERLSPRDPMGYMAEIGIGAAHFIAERYEEALVMIQRGVSRQPGATWALRWLVTTLVHAGRKDEARRVCVRLLESNPGLTVAKVWDQLPFETGTPERVAAGLREAGLPD